MPGSKMPYRFSPVAWLPAWIIAIALAVPAFGQHAVEQEGRFRDVQKWSRVFESPSRDAWQKPDRVIRALGLEPGSRVADIGAATGYFAVRLARSVPKGRVYAVDIEPEMVRFVDARAKKERLSNLTSIAGTTDDPNLPEAVDVVIMVDVYHHLADRVRYLHDLRRYLRPGGRVAIIDHLDTPDGELRSGRTVPARIKEELQRAGYQVSREHGFLPQQYFVVFKPSAR